MLTPPFGETRPDQSLLEDTLDDVLGTAARLFPTRLVAVSRIEGTSCTLMALVDHQRQIRPGAVLHVDETFCGTMLEQGGPLQINDIGALPNADRYATNAPGIPISAYLGVPLRFSGGRVFGSLWTVNSEPYAFTAHDVSILQLLGRSLTHALENVAEQQHHKRIEQLQAIRMDVDPLTGVLGRDGFLAVLADQSTWRPTFDAYTVGVVKLDPLTDSPARINMAHQALADMVMRTMRLIDYCGRIDDMTYAVLLPNTTRNTSEGWQQRLHAEIDTWNRIHREADLAFEVMLGVADSSEVDEESDSLAVLHHARRRVQRHGDMATP